MSFFKSIRKFTFALLAVIAISYGWKLYAYQQQQGGFTPPPRPVETKAPAEKNSGTKSTPSTSVYEGTPLRVGERLTFNVNWSDFATAARIEIEVVEQGVFFGQDSYQIRTKLETLGGVRSLFGDIDHQYTSYVGPKTALPHRLISSVRQGKKQIEDTVILDQSRQQATFSDESTLTIPQGTYDLGSLIHGMRLRGIPESGKQKFTVLIGKEVVEFEAVSKGREQLVTQTGTYNAVQVKLYPQTKKYSKYRIHIWFSDDAQRLPVAIQAKLWFGEVRADLTSATIAVRSLSPSVLAKAPTDESGNPPLPGEGPKGANGQKQDGAPRVINPPSVVPTPSPNLPFAVGERLNYEIAWGGFASVGKASFEVRQQGMLGGKNVFEFYGEASSVGSARTLINVNDSASSFAMVDSLLPVKTDIRLREGRRLKQTAASYDWSKKSVSLPNGTEVPIQPGTLDLLSLFYAIRAAQLKIGATYDFPFLDANHRPQKVRIRVVKQETIGGPMGARETLQLDILSPEPVQALIAQVWITNDVRRLPLYFATRTRFGELRFQMTSASNTK
ncbi:MAG TPA: DUF3108 domain-containing protein [Blastocatellia bacterium]